ncbi:ZIP family metal transporter [bacterium]|nr:MAG: ZIP family metal transporter [bacterium]
MSGLALVGGLMLLLPERGLQRMVLPLVAFSAGSLLGGAFFHMLPAALESGAPAVRTFAWVLVGFVLFFVLEQFLHWHHCHRADAECRHPLTYLILLGDALHNFLGGLAVAGTFLVDIRLGITTWAAAALHEIPQELGDFGVLLHGGWSKGKALAFNFASALTFLLGGLLAYSLSLRLDVGFLVPLAAGNFLYIAASDLVPEVNRHFGPVKDLAHFLAFVAGLLILYVLRSGL